jgi:hypothetical protein
MTEIDQPRAKCPYCGCGFIPAEPGQAYCSPFCEQQHKLEQEKQTS